MLINKRLTIAIAFIACKIQTQSNPFDEGNEDVIEEPNNGAMPTPEENFNQFASSSGQCERIKVRRNWNSLSNQEKQTYINAIRNLHQNTKRDGNSGPSYHDYFTMLHIQGYKTAHSTSYFLIWHRYFVIFYEHQLKKINPSLANLELPYWDWTAYNQRPEIDPIFQWFGSDGDSRLNNCVMDGMFTPQLFGNLYYGNNANYEPHCIKRNFNGNRARTMQPFWAPESVNRMIRSSNTYKEFRENFEYGAHAVVHNNIGTNTKRNLISDFALMNSPNDPLFWLHHSFVDKIYSDWQLYDRRNRMFDFDANRQSSVQPFSNASPNSLFDTTAFPWCYTYEPSSTTLSNPEQDEQFDQDNIEFDNEDNNGESFMKRDDIKNDNKFNAFVNDMLNDMDMDMHKYMAKNFNLTEFEQVSLSSSNEEPVQFNNTKLVEEYQNITHGLNLPTLLANEEECENYNDGSVGLSSEDSEDRLRMPLPISDEYIKMHGYDINKVRDIERRNAVFLSDLNSSGYVSPYSIKNLKAKFFGH